MTEILNILNYPIALLAIYFGYRICISRKDGKSFREIRFLSISFYVCIFLLWGITLLMAFFI